MLSKSGHRYSILVWSCSGPQAKGDGGVKENGIATDMADSVVLIESVQIHLRIPRESRRGTTVPLELVLENRSDSVVILGVGGLPVAVNFIVVDSAGQEQWRLLGAKAWIANVVSRLLLPPHSEVTLSRSWDQRVRDASPAATGTYLVVGELPVLGRQLRIGPSPIRIVP